MSPTSRFIYITKSYTTIIMCNNEMSFILIVVYADNFISRVSYVVLAEIAMLVETCRKVH